MRFTGGNCIAAFRPDLVPIPLPDAHFAYHWDGSTVDYVQTLNKPALFTEIGDIGSVRLKVL